MHRAPRAALVESEDVVTAAQYIRRPLPTQPNVTRLDGWNSQLNLTPRPISSKHCSIAASTRSVTS